MKFPFSPKLMINIISLLTLLAHNDECLAGHVRNNLHKKKTENPASYQKKLARMNRKRVNRAGKPRRRAGNNVIKPVGEVPHILPEHQLPFTIVIYGHNNAPWVKKNLDSVCSQDYSNMRIVYIDDASDDQTGTAIEAYFEGQYPENFQLISYETHQGRLKALYTLIHSCQDQEIILLVNGRDWLVNEWVLNNLCDIYNDDIWLTYGSCRSFPRGCNIGIRNGSTPDKIIKNCHFRKVFPFMPLRTFYAWLFKQIKQEDLIDPVTSDFYEHAVECYIMWPLLEMAHTRFKYIKDITYVVNCKEPLTKLTEDYYLRMACNAQMGKDIPVYPVL